MVRVNSKDSLETALDDEFLFSWHMHYDLHETVLGEYLHLLHALNEVHLYIF